MDYFDVYKLRINGDEIIANSFNYYYDFISERKRFVLRTPFGFNKFNGCVDAYPILHNLLISKEFFDMELEILHKGEFEPFAKFKKCMVTNKSFAPDGMICYEFGGTYDLIEEDNEHFLNLTDEGY